MIHSTRVMSCICCY